jgi:cytochrome c
VVWSETTIAEYVKNPKEFVPGNKMVFPGLKSDQEVADLIAYLKQATTPK